jgi:hypothetical protein
LKLVVTVRNSPSPQSFPPDDCRARCPAHAAWAGYPAEKPFLEGRAELALSREVSRPPQVVGRDEPLARPSFCRAGCPSCGYPAVPVAAVGACPERSRRDRRLDIPPKPPVVLRRQRVRVRVLPFSHPPPRKSPSLWSSPPNDEGEETSPLPCHVEQKGTGPS